MMSLEFWYDWMLATAALRGEVELEPDTLARWADEVQKAKEERKNDENGGR